MKISEMLLRNREIRRDYRAHAHPSDVVQETFLVAKQGFPEFRGRQEPELIEWLRKILVHRLANQVRRYYGTEKRNVMLEQDLGNRLERSSLALEHGLAAAGSSPSRRAGRREQAVLLADALEHLPDHCRDVIVLRQLKGLEFPEVARRMGRSLDSVKNIWPRALAQLRQELKELS